MNSNPYVPYIYTECTPGRAAGGGGGAGGRADATGVRPARALPGGAGLLPKVRVDPLLCRIRGIQQHLTP